MGMAGSITVRQVVSVVYCAEAAQYCIELPFYAGMTAQDALLHSRLAEQVTLPDPVQLGIFGLKIAEPAQYVLRAGERVEIYRPLKMNPKEVRRARAERHPVGRFQRGNQWRRRQEDVNLGS